MKKKINKVSQEMSKKFKGAHGSICCNKNLIRDFEKTQEINQESTPEI